MIEISRDTVGFLLILLVMTVGGGVVGTIFGGLLDAAFPRTGWLPGTVFVACTLTGFLCPFVFTVV